jgi:hypothetical protein
VERERAEPFEDLRQIARPSKVADHDLVSNMSRLDWRRTTIRRAVQVGLVASSIAVLGACSIEDRGPVSTSTSFDGVVHVADETPVAVRHLAFEVSRPSRPINVTLTINASRFITETTGEFAEDVTVSVRADDPATAAFAGSPGDARPGALFALTKLCREGCSSGVTVVVRGAGEARPTDDISISAVLSVSGADHADQTPLGTTLSLSDDGAVVFDGGPPTASAHVAPEVTLSKASPTAHVDLRLRVDPTLLVEPLAFPKVGSLTIRATGDPATHDVLWNHWASPIGRVTVNGEQTGMAPESGAYDIDWLRLCTVGEPCVVDVGIDIAYEDLEFRARVNESVANGSAPPPPSEYRLTIDALARLETFGAGEIPSEGLDLEVTQ